MQRATIDDLQDIRGFLVETSLDERTADYAAIHHDETGRHKALDIETKSKLDVGHEAARVAEHTKKAIHHKEAADAYHEAARDLQAKGFHTAAVEVRKKRDFHRAEHEKRKSQPPPVPQKPASGPHNLKGLAKTEYEKAQAARAAKGHQPDTGEIAAVMRKARMNDTKKL